MVDGREPWLAEMAKAGHGRALDELVERYEPIVCHVVGHGLAGHPDVDRVIWRVVERIRQDAPGLPEPGAVRAWFAARAVRQVRELRRQAQPSLTAGPVDALGLTGDARQVVEAARWLAPHDRDVFGLWWLAEAGELSTDEIGIALGLSAEEGAARVRRMLDRLDAARGLVAALAAEPACSDLMALAGGSTRPRFQRRDALVQHVEECDRCAGHAKALAPAGPLLAEAGPVPLLGPARPRQRPAARPADAPPPSLLRRRHRDRRALAMRRWRVALATLAALSAGLLVANVDSEPATRRTADPLPPTVERLFPTAVPSTPSTADATAPVAPAAAATPVLRPKPTTASAKPATPAAPAPPKPVDAWYEAEKARLYGQAEVMSMGSASGGRIVHKLGTDRASSYGYAAWGAIDFAGVTVPSAGRYTLTVFYVSGQTRSAYLRINGGTTYSRSFPSGSSWDTVRSLAFPVELRAGANTLAFSNPYDWLPRLDRIRLTPA